MRKLIVALVGACAVGGSAASAAPAPSAIQLKRADDTVLSVSLFDRGAGDRRRALLIAAGSDCRNAVSQRWIGQVVAGASPRWVAVVEKDGASPDGRCGPAYEAHATEEARWFDTLAAMHALKARLNLQDRGGFDVIAISAGGLTGCALAGATSDVRALALLSTGGGITFAEELDVLSKGDPNLRTRRGWVQAHPQIGRTWLGDTNPEIWWWSALSKRCLPLLAGFKGRVLVEQGTKDEDTPLVSATSLVAGLQKEGVAVQFHEMATGHDLGLSSLPLRENGVAYALDWLRVGRAPEPRARQPAAEAAPSP